MEDAHLPDRLRKNLHAEGTLAITVRVRPGARQSCFRDVLENGDMKIDLSAPADDGKANAELVRFLSEQLGVPRSAVELVAGQTSRRKVVCIVLP